MTGFRQTSGGEAENPELPSKPALCLCLLSCLLLLSLAGPGLSPALRITLCMAHTGPIGCLELGSRSGQGSWAGMKMLDKRSQLLSHSCSKSDSALPAPPWQTPTLSGPTGFSWHWEAWGQWPEGQLRCVPPLCTNSPYSCLVHPGHWVRISSHLAPSSLALAQFLAQRGF